MAEDFNDTDNDNAEEDFAALLDSYGDVVHEDFQVGGKVEGKIISLGEDAAFVDIGGKIDGVVDTAELLDDQGESAYGEGDSIVLYIVSADESEIKLSRALSGVGGLDMLRDALANAVPVEGRVTQTCKGGFHVELLHRRAFCPISQMDLVFVETPDDYVGQTHRFLVTQVEENGRNIVVSRRKLLEKEQEKTLEAFFEGLKVGSILDGRVTRIVPYGAFVELVAGLEGMVHVSELSWARIETPEEVVSVGQTLPVKVIDIQAEDLPVRKKIALSVKQLENDPWDTAADRFKAGEKVTGSITRCAKFGAFVEIAPGIEGLIHISEMSYTKRIIYPEDVVNPGQTVSVTVKSCDPEKRRISLSLRDAEGDPWLNVPEKYSVGQAVKGSIEKKENFGIFVLLEPGVTGLLPKSNISKAARPGMIERLKEGDTVNVVVENIDAPNRRIRLGPADVADEGDWQDFIREGEAAMNPLAEKLKNALDAKK